MNKKQFYEAPETELIVVWFEGNILSPGQPGGAGGDDTIVDDEQDMG